MNDSAFKNNLSNISKHFNELIDDINFLVQFSELFYFFNYLIVDIFFFDDVDHFEYDKIDCNQVHHDKMMKSSAFTIVQDILSENRCFFF